MVIARIRTDAAASVESLDAVFFLRQARNPKSEILKRPMLTRLAVRDRWHHALKHHHHLEIRTSNLGFTFHMKEVG